MTKARTLADNFAADINGITAGTGITGGGTSGTVTITNDMATAINAKGDLVIGTGADAYARLAVASTAGYLLSVDSAEATGLKWAAPAGGLTTGYVETTGGQASTSTSFTDLATTTSVTVTTGTKAIVDWSAQVNPSAGAYVSIAISGASSVSASDNNAIYVDSPDNAFTSSRSKLFTGLTAGSNTFTIKVRSTSGNVGYTNRTILVIDAGS